MLSSSVEWNEDTSLQALSAAKEAVGVLYDSIVIQLHLHGFEFNTMHMMD